MPYKTFSTLNNKSSLSDNTESSVNPSQFAKQKQYEGWTLVGRSPPYKKEFYDNGDWNPMSDKSTCGKWLCYGCLNTSKHHNNLLCSIKNPAFIKPIQHNCHRLRCSECYTREAYSSSVRIARRIRYFKQTPEYFNSRSILKETHVIVAPRLEINDSFPSIRSKVDKLLQDVGVIGGVLIVHHFRCEDSEYVKDGLHFHCVGYSHRARVRGSEVARQFEKHNFAIVKNKGKRKSVQKTIQYLLSHSTVHKKHHSITWFGKLSYSKLTTPEISIKELKEYEKIRCCPICQERLDKLDYVGIDRPPTEIGYGEASDYIILVKAKKKKSMIVDVQNRKLHPKKEKMKVYSSMSGNLANY
jgi:hypothetical protein